MEDRHRETLELLAELCAGLPVPDGRWHPHAAAIADVRSDFEHALRIVSGVPDALDDVAELLRAGAELPPLTEPAGAHLQDAWARLGALAVPVGRHPFLDEIVAAVDAAQATLVAIGRNDVAARRFELASVAEAA